VENAVRVSIFLAHGAIHGNVSVGARMFPVNIVT